MYKTSASHPLGIDAVRLPAGQGWIGLSQCPGACDDGLSNGPWRRDVALDVAAIGAWGARAVVSLIEPHEYALLKVEALGEALEAAGLDWYPLPIPDMRAPDWRFSLRWGYAGPRLRRLLRAGGRLHIHCRAGLGRAGMIAARLLVELGVPSAEAISQVRAARPGAIQTAAQEAHVLGVRRVSRSAEDRVAARLACLLGGALGEAFGAPLVNETLDSMTRRYGQYGMTEPRYEAGELRVGAKTQWTLFALEGLTRAVLSDEADADGLARHLRAAWDDWLETQEAGRGSGAASRLMRHAQLHARRAGAEAAARQADSCLSRAAPLAFFHDAARAFSLARPDAHAPAAAHVALLARTLGGEALGPSAHGVLPWLQALPGQADTVSRVQSALRAAQTPHAGPPPAALGQAGSADSVLGIGLYAALSEVRFEGALARAAHTDGDSAAAASVAGQLSAAQGGLDALPQRWVRRLDVLDAACDLVEWAAPAWLRGEAPEARP